jgi:hypothetical protein
LRRNHVQRVIDALRDFTFAPKKLLSILRILKQ